MPKELRWDDVLRLKKGHQQKRFTWSYMDVDGQGNVDEPQKIHKMYSIHESSNDVFGDMFYILVSKKVDF